MIEVFSGMKAIGTPCVATALFCPTKLDATGIGLITSAVMMQVARISSIDTPMTSLTMIDDLNAALGIAVGLLIAVAIWAAIYAAVASML
jgi:hypothetical protein